MVMRQCREGEKWCRYCNSFKVCIGIFAVSDSGILSTLELLWDIHGCPVSKRKAPWIRAHRRNKARAVMALHHHYSNSNLFHGETVKGINKVLSLNTPTPHTMQAKLIMQLKRGLFFMFQLDFNLFLALRTENMTMPLENAVLVSSRAAMLTSIYSYFLLSWRTMLSHLVLLCLC